MNRKLLFGAAFFFAGIHVSAASDLPLPETYDSDWSGLYATLSAGYSEVKLEGEEVNLLFGGDDKDSSSGAVFGAGLGYNFDLGDFVIGVEGDINYLTNENTLDMKSTVDADYDWFATGRLRAGFDLDGTLIYATGGAAWLAADFEGTIFGQSGTDHQTYFGWTAGGGIEHMFSDSLSLRVEGLYADFPSEDVNLDDGDPAFIEIESDVFLVRAGLSWRFFSP